VVNHQTAIAMARASAKVIEAAAFVVNDRRHTSLPRAARKVLSRSRNEVNTSM
jgi:hypothetical protein